MIPPFLLFCCWLHSSTQRIEWFPLPLGEFRSVSTADLEDPSRGSRNNAGNGDVSELQIDRKKIRTSWHCDSQHHLACHILCEKNHAIFWGEFNGMFHYKPAFCWGAKGDSHFSSLKKSCRNSPQNLYNFASHPKKLQRVEVATSEELLRASINCMFAAANYQNCALIHRKIPKFCPLPLFWCLFLKKQLWEYHVQRIVDLKEVERFRDLHNLQLANLAIWCVWNWLRIDRLNLKYLSLNWWSVLLLMEELLHHLMWKTTYQLVSRISEPSTVTFSTNWGNHRLPLLHEIFNFWKTGFLIVDTSKGVNPFHGLESRPARLDIFESFLAKLEILGDHNPQTLKKTRGLQY